MLARNWDVEGAVQSVREIEDRFNRNHNYPWVFLNEQPFTDDFKRCITPPSNPPLHAFSVYPDLTPVSHTSVACRSLPLGLWILA
jgi:alpha 1,2-mannosyltransferase